MKSLKLVAMIEASFFAVFAIILDLLPSIKPIPSISISISMIPIFILAFRRGFKVSLISGLLWGILQIALGLAWIVTPVQAFIEYFLAFACIGFAGIIYQVVQKNLQAGHKKKVFGWMILGVFIGSFVRYFWHFIAGVIFFAEYAPENMSPVLFSFAANGISMLGSALLCAIMLILLVSASSRIIITQKGNHPTTSTKRVS